MLRKLTTIALALALALGPAFAQTTKALMSLSDGATVVETVPLSATCKTDWRQCTDNKDLANYEGRFAAGKACVAEGLRIFPGGMFEFHGMQLKPNIHEGGRVVMVEDKAGLPLEHIEGMYETVRAFCTYNFATNKVEHFMYVNWDTKPYYSYPN